jgi:hypothetical protein
MHSLEVNRSPSGRRGRTIVQGATALLVAVGLAASGLGPARAADPPTAAGEKAPRRVEPRPGSRCYNEGFCGSEGWAYGDYADHTKESTGCNGTKDDSDAWDLGVSHTPIRPEFTRANCSFFYNINVCSIATVVCLN